MAKAARPGRVKTRLTRGPGSVTPDVAARVHYAMGQTVIDRLANHLHPPAGATRSLILALDDPAATPAFHAPDWQVMAQGEGDLGQRIDRIWQAAARAQDIDPVSLGIVFFGVDSPDVPEAVLRGIPEALAEHDAAVGPVGDGGYWTLAARGYRPQLVEGIDWGSSAVYDQTHAAASACGIDLVDLPAWHDVDEPADLANLQRRLASATEPILQQLAQTLGPAPDPRP